MSETDPIRADTGRERQMHESFADFKGAANISNLNTAIYLFQQAAYKSQEGLDELVKALITHLIYTGDMRSILAAGVLVSHICLEESDMKQLLTSLPLGCDFSEVEDDAEDILRCASAMLNDFYGSIKSEALERLINGLTAVTWDTLHDRSEALLLRFHISGRTEDWQECMDITQNLYDILPTRYGCLCAALLTCTDRIFDPYRCMEALRLCGTGAVIDAEAVGWARYGTTLLTDALQSGNPKHIDSAIDKLKKAEVLISWGHPTRPLVLDDLAVARATRFEQSGTEDDMEEALRLLRESLAIQSIDPANYPLRDRSLSALGSTLQSHFEKHGDLLDIEEAVELHRESLQLRYHPHPDRGAALMRLASAIQARFGQKGDLRDIEEAIEFHQDALALLSESDTDRSVCLRNLGIAVRTRFEHTRDSQDIDNAVIFLREALKLPSSHLNQAHTLNNLANTLRIRFEQQGNLADINEAIDLNRVALLLRPTPHPHRSTSLTNLAIVVGLRFNHRGDQHDIDEAIALHTEALALRTDGHPERAKSLNNLAAAIETRFIHRGDAEDIDKVIELGRRALEFRPPGHPDRSGALSNLAGAISARFHLREEIQDLDEAVKLQQEALTLIPVSHVNHGDILRSLASELLTRYHHKNDPQDIDDAIQMNRDGLQFLPQEHPAYGHALSQLGTALATRFNQRGDSQAIDEAVNLHRRALAILPSTDVLNALSGALLDQAKSKNLARKEILEEALGLQRKALQLVSPRNINRGNILCNLAHVLILSHEETPNDDYFNEAFSFLQDASTYNSSPPLARFRAACIWAEQASRHQHFSAISAYQTAIGHLPQVAALHLDLESRRQSISTADCVKLVSSAGTYAISLNEYAIAVEFLETSRSVFWSQALHLHAPLDRLRHVKPSGPQLAARVAELSKELQGAAFRNTTRDPLNDTNQKIVLMEAEGARCRRLNQEWEDTIQSVRNLAGFQDFMRPKDIVALRQAAVHGPIVILIAGKDSSHALVVRASQEVQCVSLPEVSLASVKIYVRLVRALTGSECSFRALVATLPRGQQDLETRLYVTARLFGRREGHDNRNPNDIFRTLLRDLWLCIVQPVFVALGLKKSPTPHRLWWCPTGLFAFLPIHAAGLYGALGADCVSDYIISSYTPTLTPLLDALYRTTTPFKMTAVIQPQSDFSPLPATRQELENIRKKVPAKWLTALGDITDATVDQALSHLLKSSIVHFACHGRQDPANPLNSGLVLSDGRLKVSEIIRSRGGAEDTDLGKRMSLAFLSACETAKGDDNVPDEAMHLAATLLFAGFRGLVATMWQMADNDGPKIADSFYEHLFRNCDVNSEPPVLPDLTEAAYALHLAVMKLRDEPDIPFTRWVPFVHYCL
ncbi:CHAT domain-containing protein [Mycena epipterygia]|nr:CHAT domain-containing protein [Mycena epipterygia]